MRPGRALVTGAARRLGRAMALDLARQGWAVAIHYGGSAEAAEETAAAARVAGGQAATLEADLLVEADVAGLVGRAREALGGPLTLLVNNASIFEPDGPATMTRESWDRAVESNLRAAVKLAQDFGAQAPEAEADRNGEPVARACIVNMLDQRLLKPTPHFLSYTVAKAGLLMATRTLAQAFAPNVRVMGIGPGPTLRADRQSEAHYARQRAGCVLGRGSDPEDIVAALNFILACKALTGQMIAVDGGQHLAWQTADMAGEPL